MKKFKFLSFIFVSLFALTLVFGRTKLINAASIIRIIGDDLQSCPVAGCALAPTVGSGGDTVIETKLGVGALPSATSVLNVGGDSLFNSNRIKFSYAGSSPASGPSIKFWDGTYTNNLGLYVSGGLLFQGNAGNPAFRLFTPTTNGALGTEVVHLGAASTADNSWISRYFGIGRSPGTVLDVNVTANSGTFADTDAIRFWDGTNGWQIGENPSSFFQLWRLSGGNTVNAPDITVDTTGKFGIGTATAPTYKLQVPGDIYANGGWFRIAGTNGLYWETQGTRIYATANHIRTGSNNGIVITNAAGSANLGYVYSDGSNFGLLNAAGNWMFYSPISSQNVVFNGSWTNVGDLEGAWFGSIVARKYSADLVRVPIFSTTSASYVTTGTGTNPFVFDYGSIPAALPGTVRNYHVYVGWSGGNSATSACVVRLFRLTDSTAGEVNNLRLGTPWADNRWQVNSTILSTTAARSAGGYRVDMYSEAGTTCYLNDTAFVEEDSVDGNDYAEDVESYQNLLNGDIVSVDQGHNSAIVISYRPYQSDVAGVVSTEPGIDIGKVRVGGKPFPLALSGRVPTNVSTINGPIHRGDIITTSSLQGIGMKATKAGPTVGKAYEEFDCQSYANCRDISKVKYWVDDQTVKVDPTTAKGKIYPVTQIVMMLNVSWYDPDVFLTSIDGFNIKFTGPVAQLFNAAGEQIDRVGIFGDAIIAHLKAGVIEVKTSILNGKNLSDEIIDLNSQITTLEEEVKILKNQP